MKTIKSILATFLLIFTLTSCDETRKWDGQWTGNGVFVDVNSETMKVNVRIPSKSVSYTSEWSVIDDNSIVWQGSLTSVTGSNIYTVLDSDGNTFYFNPRLNQEPSTTTIKLHKK